MVRIKHRYLLINFLYPESRTKSKSSSVSNQSQEEVPWVVHFRQPSSDLLDARLLVRMIRDRVAELFGDYGSGVISGSLQVKYLSTATSVAIVRVARAQYRLVWAALTCTTRIPPPVDQPCVIQVVRVSGTIKKSEEEAIRRARSMIKFARRAMQGPSSLTDENRSMLGLSASRESKDQESDAVMSYNSENPVEPSDRGDSEMESDDG